MFTRLTLVRHVGAVVAVLALGCQCGGPRLISTVDGEEPALPTTVLTCGNAVVEDEEECDFGFEGNTGGPGSCTPDCTLSRTCAPGQSWREEILSCVADDAGLPADAGAPPDAGPVADAGRPDAGPPDAGLPDAGPPAPDAGPVDAVLTGTLTVQTPMVAATSVLHPTVPLPGARVHLRLRGSPLDLTSVLTDALGQFRFDVSSGVAYELRYTVPPPVYSEPSYHRIIAPLAPGETRVDDYSFFPMGVHFVVRDGVTSALLSQVLVTVEVGNAVIAGPFFTDVEGYVHFPSTAVPGTLVLQKPGYQTLRLGQVSVDTTHTVFGGCILQR